MAHSSEDRSPDPEVIEIATRRQFSASEKRMLLAEADRCKERGELGAFLRSKRIYSSMLSSWRKQIGAADRSALAPKRRDHQDLSKTEFLGLLVDDEWIYRENRKLTARLKVAKFKLRAATIESIDYATPRGLRKDQILELTQNRLLRAHETLLINGPSGSGKSFLAQAFEQHACRSGFPVQYLRMPALLTLFVQARAQGTYDRLLKHFGKTSLLTSTTSGLPA